MTMRSYQIIEFGKPLKETTAETPEPQGTEVLVRVMHCGVCHSDIHLWSGYYDLGGGKRITLSERGAVLPFTMGHEIYGEVVAAGPDAKDVRIGAKAAIFPWIGCGSCVDCGHGRELWCARSRNLGTKVHGGYSDHVVVPHGRYVIECTEVDGALAATCSCSGLTAYSALKKLPELTSDDVILLIGAGGVGLAAVGIAVKLGAARVIVAEIDPLKRQAALEAGAHAAFDPLGDDATAEYRKITERLPSGVIDFVGVPSTAELAANIVGRGGTVVFVGLYGAEIPVSVSRLAMQNISLKGSNVGTLEEFRELMGLMASGAITPIPITRRPMAQVNEILEEVSSGKVLGRVVMQP